MQIYRTVTIFVKVIFWHSARSWFALYKNMIFCLLTNSFKKTLVSSSWINHHWSRILTNIVGRRLHRIRVCIYLLVPVGNTLQTSPETCCFAFGPYKVDAEVRQPQQLVTALNDAHFILDLPAFLHGIVSHCAVRCCVRCCTVWRATARRGVACQPSWIHQLPSRYTPLFSRENGMMIWMNEDEGES